MTRGKRIAIAFVIGIDAGFIPIFVAVESALTRVITKSIIIDYCHRVTLISRPEIPRKSSAVHPPSELDAIVLQRDTDAIDLIYYNFIYL